MNKVEFEMVNEANHSPLVISEGINCNAKKCGIVWIKWNACGHCACIHVKKPELKVKLV